MPGAARESADKNSLMRAQAKILKIIRFGNPILRMKAKELSIQEIQSDETQQLIQEIKATNQQQKYGVAIAAPQVDESIALVVVDIKPTKARPKAPKISMVIINPSYEGIGRRAGMWEGCLSSGKADDTLFGKALRYRKIDAIWRDEHGDEHSEQLDGILAHVFQHETDHLNGILFVDKVRDSKTFMLADEYRARIVRGGVK